MKYKDTDYLYASSRIRVLEKNLLDTVKTERMIEAKTPEEAARVLAESGYGDIVGGGIRQLERTLSDMRAETIKLISDITPNHAISDVFALRYDFHNIKVIIKAELTGASASRLLTDSGTIPSDTLAAALHSGDMRDLPPKMAEAIAAAREVIAHTGDPQPADFILDRACFSMMADAAVSAQSEFLKGYVRLLADTANLRTVVRATRQGKELALLRDALIPNGNVAVQKILSEPHETVFSGGELSAAAEAGALAAQGATGLTEFERLCDNALISYMQRAKYVAFGERPLAAYIAAREAEAMTIRIIMAGKLENLPPDEIRSRLRLSYV